MPTRRARLTAALLWLLMLSGAARAQSPPYPSKPIRLVLPSGPGAGPDVIARLLAPRWSDALGQPVVLENRPGAGTSIAANAVAGAPPDGYTLFFGITATFAIAPWVIANAGYDPVASFTPISQLTAAPFVLFAHPALTDSIGALVETARAKPGALRFAGATGTLPHFAGILFNSVARVELTHVPYKSMSGAYPDLLAGRVPLLFEPLAPLRAHVESGKVRALVVAGKARHRLLPEVPSALEAGLAGLDITSWFGLLGPKGMPAPVLTRLSETVSASLRSADTREALSLQGMEAIGSAPEAFASFIASEVARWEPIVKAAGLKPE